MQHYYNSAIATLCVHPIDVYTICRQASVPINFPYSTRNGDMVNHSMWGRVWKGAGTSVSTRTIYFGLYFNSFNYLRTLDSFKSLRYFNINCGELAASGISALAVTIVTNPLWYLKTVLQSQGTSFSNTSSNITFIGGVGRVVRQPWKGLQMSLVKGVETCIRYPCYRYLNQDYNALVSTIGCLLIFTPLYPINNLKETLRMSTSQLTYKEVGLKLIQTRGLLRGLFRGYSFYFTRSLFYYGILYQLEKVDIFK